MATYIRPASNAVNFLEQEVPYIVPAGNAVNFELLEGVQITVQSPLGACSNYVFNNFYPDVTETTDLWVMRITGDPVVEIPITSWQATIQADRQSFVQAVVPNASDYSNTFTARQGSANFEIYRLLYIGDDPFYEFVTSAPLQTVTLYEGPYKETATIIGYGDAVDGAVNFVGDRTMTNIRQITTVVNGNVRARGDIDTLYRPGNNIIVNALTITASYVNIFVTTEGDSYMEVGTR